MYHNNGIGDRSPTKSRRALPSLRTSPPDYLPRIGPCAVRQTEDLGCGDGRSIDGKGGEFKLNSGANIFPGGGINFTKKLSPIPSKKPSKQQDLIPPLDLSTLRGSTDSTNSFKPYTGTSRSTDTYRFTGDTKPDVTAPLPNLKTLPEVVFETGT